MATKPEVKTFTATSADILNAIRNNASANYKDYVPVATSDADSVREIGAIIMNYPALQNEFLTALVNRIGLVIITSKLYSNPWSVFKKGLLEFGETIEEIFVNVAKPFEFNPEVAETKVMSREIPDVRAAFHVLNYQKFYKSTVGREQLRQAFMSWAGLTDLVNKIIEEMYSSANYDEFLAMKYLLARHILNGRLAPVQISTVSTTNMSDIVATIKGVSNNLEFMSDEYNPTGVSTYTNKNDQFIIVNAKFDATMDVEVLATAFNMSKADFMGRRIMIDSFGAVNTARLNLLMAEQPNYTPITTAEAAALDAIPAVIIDRNWFMVYDNLFEFTEMRNPEGLYWNYWFHTWKTLSVSPFANAVVFVPGAPSVTSVSVSPATVTANKGQNVLITATVVTANFASKAVTWTSDGTGVTITPTGLVHIPDDFTGTTINVTATSVADSTKTATAVITVS